MTGLRGGQAELSVGARRGSRHCEAAFQGMPEFHPAPGAAGGAPSPGDPGSTHGARGRQESHSPRPAAVPGEGLPRPDALGAGTAAQQPPGPPPQAPRPGRRRLAGPLKEAAGDWPRAPAEVSAWRGAAGPPAPSPAPGRVGWRAQGLHIGPWELGVGEAGEECTAAGEAEPGVCVVRRGPVRGLAVLTAP